ncbi:MAG: TonB-dependent receptor [Acidobacteria bacterium]|nr:TonB-dependent receptor [Acidobacteriota bacterium]MBI3655297.1 TonB-dependent receptor [Acidobacteriota bacterium]
MIVQKGRLPLLRGIFLLYAFWIPGLVLAQEGTITGRITDPQGGVIPGVTLTATSVGKGVKVTTRTNHEGLYTFPFLQPGNYQLTTDMPGFKPVVRSGLKLDVQQVARIDFVLEIGTPDQEVTVEANTPRLERETSSVGQVVENKTVVTLPLNGRNYSQLALLAPGAVPNPTPGATDGLSLNGSRAYQTSFLIDGVENNNYILGSSNDSTQAFRPSIDAIQEFKVETANYSAEFGHAAGGVINVSIKSGTNEFHGAAFEFLRNDKLDANNFFSNRTGLKRPPLRYNQLGGTIGGPVLRHHTFFFASYQGTRIRRPDTVITTVPTPDMVRGHFGRVAIYDPLNRQPFPNSVIPESRMDAVGRRLVALYPAPNLPGAVNNYVSNVSNKDDRGQYDLRVDHRIGTKDSLFVRYGRSSLAFSQGSVFGPPGNGGAGLFQFPALRPSKAYAVGLSETHIFSSTLVNEARAAYTRIDSDQQSPATKPLYEEYGIRGVPQFPGLTGLPMILVTGFSSLGDATFTPNPRWSHWLQLSDGLSWIRGKHTLKLGGDLRLRTNSGRSGQLARGSFTFNGQFTASAVADLLLGQTSSATLTTTLPLDLRDDYYGFFIHDTWRLSRRLTLNLGLRHELQTPMWERHNRMSNFDLDPRSPTYGQLAPARDGSIRSRAFANLDKRNFAPRIGFAYSVDPKTVVRGALGIFYGGFGWYNVARSQAANLPYFVNITVPSPRTAPLSYLVLAEGFPPGILDPRNARNPAVTALAPNFQTPQIYQWNVCLERESVGDTVLSLAYVGSSSSRLRGFNDINAPEPGPGPINSRRPFPTLGIIGLQASFVHATYHSMQAKLERRFNRGFSLLSSYTWSHSIDNSTDLESDAFGTGTTIPQNPNNIRAEKASSAMDVRHRFTSSLIYDLPFGRRGGWTGDSAVIRAVLGGWQLGGIFVAQSGAPMTPIVNPNLSDTTTPIRPDRVRDGNLPRGARSIDRWFDPSAFAPPARYTFGNSGRAVLRAPGLVNLDLLLGRNFQITETKRLELRGESFNLTNSAHFGRPDITINQPQAGRITSTQIPNRQVQIGLRFVF